MNPSGPLFIVFEGIDGAGKTTQIDRLETFLGTANVERLRLREPGGTAVGERVRSLLKDPEFKAMTPMTELLLFMAARQQLVDERIRPALDAGKVVLLDRYYYSTMAYQGAAGKVGTEEVRWLAENYLKLPQPDVIYLFDIDPDVAVKRRSQEFQDRIEAKGLQYQRDVRAAFVAIAARHPKFLVIDASQPADAIHKFIVDDLWSWRDKRRAGGPPIPSR